MLAAPRRRSVLLAVAALVALAGCAPEDVPPVASSASTGNAACAKGALRLVTPRTLTVGTGKPASEPWFKADNPANGQGFESAVAYAVAEQLGFGRSEVSWVTVPFDASSAPGRKSFDFDINQISITEARREAVDLSKGYYDVTQAVVALRTSPVADATTIAELKDAKLAARAGSTSLQAIQQTVRPAQQPAVHNDDNDTRTAVQNGAVDAAVFDLPTAFRLVAAEIGNAKIVGQFPSPAGLQEQFGMLFEKGNPLVSCVNQALATLRSGGQLAKIQQQWLAGSAGAPELK